MNVEVTGVLCQGTSTAHAIERLRIAREAGWSATQVSLLGDHTPTEWRTVIEAAETLGLRVVALGAYATMIDPSGPRFAGTTIANAHAAIEACRDLPPHARRVVVWGGTFSDSLLGAHPRNARIDTWDKAILTCALLVADLHALGGSLVVEPFHTHFLGCARDYILFFRELERNLGLAHSPPDAPVGLVLDPPNFVDFDGYARLDARVEETIEVLGPYTRLVHLKDIAYVSGEKGPELALPAPGDGDLDYTRFVRALRRHLPPDVPYVAEHFDADDKSEHLRIRSFLGGL